MNIQERLKIVNEEIRNIEFAKISLLEAKLQLNKITNEYIADNKRV